MAQDERADIRSSSAWTKPLKLLCDDDDRGTWKFRENSK
jgi:hypothetical protein